MTFRRLSGWAGAALLALFVPVGFTGCQSADTNAPGKGIGAVVTSDVLQAGDHITITLTGPPDLKELKPIEQTIKDDGTIGLSLIGSVKAAGKKKGELEKDIHDLYVPKYYKHLNVVVTPDNRFYYVYGYVKTPSRQVHIGEITVTKAIASSGGFSEYARMTKVRLTRSNGEVIIVDCDKALKDPKLDLPVYPGDNIYVPLRTFFK